MSVMSMYVLLSSAILVETSLIEVGRLLDSSDIQELVFITTFLVLGCLLFLTFLFLFGTKINNRILNKTLW